MKRSSILLASVAALGLLTGGRAYALSEPEPINGGDERFREVTYRNGEVIRLVGALGKSLMVEIVSPGIEIFSVLTSDQDVMDNVKVKPQEMNGRSASASPAKPEDEEGGNGCALTPNIQYCIQRGRFVFFKPLTNLTPQPVPVILLRPIPGRDAQEITVMFEISTVTLPAQPQYGVRVRLAAPSPGQGATASGGVSASAGQGSAPRPLRPRVAPRIAPVAPEPPPSINNAYTVQGDRRLLGEPGR